MATLNKASFEAKYNDAGTGIFRAGQTRGIGSEDGRALVEDEADSVPFTADDSYTWASPQVTATGTDTYAATPDPVISAYATGQKFQIKFTNASSGVSTLNLNTVGAKKIFINPTTQATTGHIVAGQISILVYDAALDAAAGGFLMIGAPPTTSGTVTSVSGTTNRITSTGGATPVIDIAAAYDAAIAAADALRQLLINSATALTDAASMDLTAIKHTLTTSSATRTFTISYTGDDITLIVTLNTTTSVFTFPATSLCVSEGAPSGDNTCTLEGTSGDKYAIAIKKIGSDYYVVSKNFGQ
jgi:hypothetical protein